MFTSTFTGITTADRAHSFPIASNGLEPVRVRKPGVADVRRETVDLGSMSMAVRRGTRGE
jgi:hypothetical protein